MAPTIAEITESINLLLWGPECPKNEILHRWSQGFQFSPYESTALLQLSGGPCAVIAAVQAAIFRQILFGTESSTISDNVDTCNILAQSLIEIFQTISSKNDSSDFHLFFWDEVSTSESTSDNLGVSIPDEPVQLFSNFINGMKQVVAPSIEELFGIIISVMPQLTSKYGLLCFVYSILYTHGLEEVKSGMLGETESLIDPIFGSSSQCLLNLLITGRSTPHVFDGQRNLSGFNMQGITEQPKTGFLTVLEALRYCEVGWYLKNPSTSIWILGSETHFTVLASTNKNLVSVEIPNSDAVKRVSLRQAEQEFLNLSETDDAGFLPYEKLGALSERLGMPNDSENLALVQQAVDPDGLGIILREPFLQYFYPEEFQSNRNPISEFEIIHFNGLINSNTNSEVRYQFGQAKLLDPLEDTNPLGKTAIEKCLKTKWTTIQIDWNNNTTPSLN